MNKLPSHISGKLHVTGSSRFIGDEAPHPNMLYAKFLLSPVAHAKILSLDCSRARQYPGVYAVYTASDIPGHNQIGHIIKDEPLFPEDKIMYIGQPLAMVLSHDPLVAETAVKLLDLQFEELVPILDIDEADGKKEWYVAERKIECGDVDKAFAQAEHILTGSLESGGQEHFYMETQRCRAIPGEGLQLTLYTATQSTMEVQEVASHVLGIAAHNIIVDVPRLGGAFGGKERAGTIWACMAALGAYLSRRPVEVLLTRDEDMLITGKRHPFKTYYKLGYSAAGKIVAYDIELLANGGAYSDLSVAILERAMFHADGSYFIPNARIRGRACRTNLPPNTAYRGFGAPQGIFVIESLMDQIAAHLQIDPIALRKLNTYRTGDTAPYGQTIPDALSNQLFERMEELAQYSKMQNDVAEFNKNHQYQKQGIGFAPVKFGISFTTALLNQGSALLWVYIDGTMSLTTGGVEMGQEVSTKCAVVVSRVLGVPIESIRVESNNSQRVGNASPTAASTGSDINGNAARIAAENVRSNLMPAAIAMLRSKFNVSLLESDVCFEDGYVRSLANPEHRIAFTELVRYAYVERIPLAAYGYYKTPGVWFDREKGIGNPFHYYVFGCALARVEIDLLTGEHVLKDTYIVHDNANSLHPDIDRGQIIGAFIQGYGWCTMEELIHDKKGKYLSVNPSTYKIPGIRDLPQNLVVDIVSSQTEHASVMGSKATGEPPFIYGMAVFFALQQAIRTVNKDAALRFPATPEAILMALE